MTFPKIKIPYQIKKYIVILLVLAAIVIIVKADNLNVQKPAPENKNKTSIDSIFADSDNINVEAAETKQETIIPTDGSILETLVKDQPKVAEIVSSDSLNDGIAKIEAFLAKRSNAYTDEYLKKIYSACGNDIHSVKLIVAVSGHETGFGTKGSPKQGYKWNFWGWGYNSKTKTYSNGTQEQMATALCKGFKPGGAYHNLISDGVISLRLATIYSGNDRPNTWAANVFSFYTQMS